MRRFLLWVMLCSLVAQGGEVLTNKDVIDLIGAGLGSDLVARRIEGSDNVFDMSPKAMVKLKENKVPDPIIEIMLQQFLAGQKKLRSRIAVEVQNLASDNEEMRRRAFLYLKSLDTAAFEQIRQALGANSDSMRAAAAKALGDLGDKDAAPVLRELLIDQSQAVRYAAADSLALLQDDMALKLARSAVTGGNSPLDAYLKLLGLRKDLDYAGFISLRLLKESDVSTREQAAWALGEIRSSQGLKALEDSLINDQKMEVKKQAALALGKIHAPESFEKLTESCRNFPQIRNECLEAIGRYPPAQSVPFLIGAIGQQLTPEELKTVRKALRRLTNRDFEDNVPEWLKWLRENEKNLAKTNPEDAAALPAPDSKK